MRVLPKKQTHQVYMLVATLVVLVLLILSATVPTKHYWPGDPIEGAFGLKLGKPIDAVSAQLLNSDKEPHVYYVEPKLPSRFFVYHWVKTAGANGPVIWITGERKYFDDVIESLPACLKDLDILRQWLDKHGYVFKSDRGRHYQVDNGNRLVYVGCKPFKDKHKTATVGTRLTIFFMDRVLDKRESRAGKKRE